MTERQVQLIQDFQPDAILVTPSYMLVLVDALEKAGIDPASTSLQVGVFGAEPWTEDMRSEMEKRCDILASDIYGLSEVVGPGVAMQCVEGRDGLHVWEDHFYPEIIDPSRVRCCPTGDGRAGVHLAHQGSAADHPVPHAGPDPAAAGYRAADAADREDHRPVRRHDHPARG